MRGARLVLCLLHPERDVTNSDYYLFYRVTFVVNVVYSSSTSFSKLKDAQKGGIFLSLSRGETYVIREMIRIVLTVH